MVGDFGSGFEGNTVGSLHQGFGPSEPLKWRLHTRVPAFGTKFFRTVRNFLIHCRLSFISRGSLCNFTGFPLTTFPLKLWHNGTQQYKVPRGTRTRDPPAGVTPARFALATSSSLVPDTFSP